MSHLSTANHIAVTMGTSVLLKPTLHIEVLLKHGAIQSPSLLTIQKQAAAGIRQYLLENVDTVQVGDSGLEGINEVPHSSLIESVDVVDYTGPAQIEAHHRVHDADLDVVAFVLKVDEEAQHRRRKSHSDEQEDTPQARVLSLPNVTLKEEWGSLIYEDCLPSQLLRYLTRMLGIIKQPGLNLSTFNWNRLCLLHGPPGSGKSTLCRALAQKLSIRLSSVFPHSILVEINTNSMLSKYFGESGKLISSLFEKIYESAKSSTTLVCVVMDEVETIAGSREKSNAGKECSDNVRATNQLLTALDRLKMFPNVIILSTSNLIEAIDPAFLDRVDIKQFVPSPSPKAMYNIFRSCLNELVGNGLIDLVTTEGPDSPVSASVNGSQAPTHPRKAEEEVMPMGESVLVDTLIPDYSEMFITCALNSKGSASRVWVLAQKCEGFSGRTLRRLPILGMAMYTWGGTCSLGSAVSALELAVEQELKVKQGETDGVQAMPGSF